MINELYQLSVALEQAGVRGEYWHRKYNPLPSVKESAPCIHIVLNHGEIARFESVDRDMAAQLRKYGSKQGTFPAMNLAPLYRVTDADIKNALFDLWKGKIDKLDVERIKGWCSEFNWGRKFKNKYLISAVQVPRELQELFQESGVAAPHMAKLIQEFTFFQDPVNLHKALEESIFSMLKQKRNVVLALRLLFHAGDKGKNPEDDAGTLSVIFGSSELENEDISTASAWFTREFNQALLQAEANGLARAEATETDAFGIPFQPLEEPMPNVKLAGGFDVTLRTMFKGQPCQHRYGRIENETYPISKDMRLRLQQALTWISSAERKNLNWINTVKDEILFSYSSSRPEIKAGFVSIYKRIKSDDGMTFEAASEKFLKALRQGKKPGTEMVSERLQIFILRKVDKARAKVVYSYNTTPMELEARAQRWSLGCRNLPKFPFGQPFTIYPIDAAEVLNRAWKQDGQLAADRFRPVPAYHGLELLFGQNTFLKQDIHRLVQNSLKLGVYAGKRLTAWKSNVVADSDWWKVKQSVALLGMLLYELDIRKEEYMKDFAFQYGQLLSVSDELHAIYCLVERGKDGIPAQLVGNSMYLAATERPQYTLNQLGQRMQPYIGWAKGYSKKEIVKEGVSSKLVGHYLNVYNKIALQLEEMFTEKIHFTEIEKGLFYLGYMAALPKSGKKQENELTEITGGTEHE